MSAFLPSYFNLSAPPQNGEEKREACPKRGLIRMSYAAFQCNDNSGLSPPASLFEFEADLGHTLDDSNRSRYGLGEKSGLLADSRYDFGGFGQRHRRIGISLQRATSR